MTKINILKTSSLFNINMYDSLIAYENHQFYPDYVLTENIIFNNKLILTIESRNNFKLILLEKIKNKDIMFYAGLDFYKTDHRNPPWVSLNGKSNTLRYMKGELNESR